jgi:hypothetical protein
MLDEFQNFWIITKHFGVDLCRLGIAYIKIKKCII